MIARGTQFSRRGGELAQSFWHIGCCEHCFMIEKLSLRSLSCFAVALSFSACAPSDPGTDGNGRRHVFVSSVLHDGNFGGLDGGDAFCMSVAQGANLLGTYRAYLFDSNTGDKPRLREGDPYYLVDGVTLVLDGMLNFGLGPFHPIDHDEHGAQISPSDYKVWTGRPEAPPLSNCQNWTVGDASAKGSWGDATDASAWQNHGFPNSCQSQLRLYCFEQ